MAHFSTSFEIFKTNSKWDLSKLRNYIGDNPSGCTTLIGGEGKPVVLIHGWPSTAQMWEYQQEVLAAAGYRVITYDRRGFGRSSVPYQAYDYDHLASDLNALIVGLDLQEVTLIGFSMGGGEVVRYLSRYGSGRVGKVVLIGSVTPFLHETPDNPHSAPTAFFEGMFQAIQTDRADFFEGFGKTFFGVQSGTKIPGDAYLHYFHTLSMTASSHATIECARAFAYTDFRKDLPTVTVPTLIIHGDADQVVPIEISGNRTAKALPHARYIVYSGAPHGLFFTHREHLNTDLLAFLAQ